MNNKVIIAIVVLLVLGVGGFFVASKYKASPTTPTPVESTKEPTTGNSLKGLLALGTSQSCTFDNSGNPGTIYVSDGKVRGDFESSVSGKTIKTHMIIDGKTTYMWTEGEKTGFKMSFDTSAEPSTPGASTQTSGAVDANATMNYNCSPWVADIVVFTLPKGVSFKSFTIPSSAPVPTGLPAGTLPSGY